MNSEPIKADNLAEAKPGLSPDELARAKKQQNDLVDFLSFAFSDLIHLANERPSIFEEYYYNRVQECEEFESYMEWSPKNATNILITGEAGIGKSNFIHKLISNTSVIESLKLHPILLDYRNVAPMTTTAVILEFIKQMEVYFRKIGIPLPELDLSADAKIQMNVHSIKRHLDAIDKNAIGLHLVIFLDDLDYAEANWFELLSFLLPFAASNKLSMVLSVRPPLLQSINDYDDRFRHHFVRDAHRIKLNPLPAEDVIATRIGPILEDQRPPSALRLLKWILRRDSPLPALAKKMGIGSVDDLPRLSYPFTGKLHIFMKRITNGNLRETFDIALESIKYMRAHPELETRIENEIPRIVLPREDVLRMLFDKQDDDDRRFRIINIHSKISRKSGASLYYSVLEAVRYLRSIDKGFYEKLSRLGHAKDDVDHAIGFLSNKTNRLIYATKIYPPEPVQLSYRQSVFDKAAEPSIEYDITSKGDLYIQMANEWEEYIERCGVVSKSLKNLEN